MAYRRYSAATWTFNETFVTGGGYSRIPLSFDSDSMTVFDVKSDTVAVLPRYPRYYRGND